MDYQSDRILNDYLLEITTRKLIPRQLWKLWKWPYMLKMLKLDKGPKDDVDAVRHFEVLNRWRTIKNLVKVNERYMNKSSVPASIEWNALYRKRNHEMVRLIVDKIHQTDAKRSVVIVGASHVPYFVYELHQQAPNTKIRFLDLP